MESGAFHRFGVVYGENGVKGAAFGRLLKSLELSWQKARPRALSPDRRAQAAFKKDLPAVMRDVAEQHPDKRLELWFQDAWKQSFQGVGQKGRATRLWCARGTRPRRPVQVGCQSTWLFGVVCPHQGRGCALVLPIATTEAMARFLAELAEQVGDEAHAVVVLDGAGRPIANDLDVPVNLTLLRLPAYGPELNPVEKLWQYLRERYLSHRVLSDYEAVVAAACDAWNRLVAEPGRIASLTRFPWLPASVSTS